MSWMLSVRVASYALPCANVLIVLTGQKVLAHSRFEDLWMIYPVISFQSIAE